MPKLSAFATLVGHWCRFEEQHVTDTLNLLSDGRWHPLEEFSSRALAGVPAGRHLALIEVDRGGVRLTPRGREILAERHGLSLLRP